MQLESRSGGLVQVEIGLSYYTTVPDVMEGVLLIVTFNYWVVFMI